MLPLDPTFPGGFPSVPGLPPALAGAPCPLGLPPLPGLPPILDPASPEFRYRQWRARGSGQPWPRHLLVAAARAVAARHDRPLTILRFEGLTGIDRRHVYRQFDGGWTELVNEAGIEPAPRGRRIWTDERLLGEFDRLTCRIGRLPTLLEFNRLAACSSQTLKGAFGTKPHIIARYDAWLAEHGLDRPTEPEEPELLDTEPEPWTRESLIAAARGLAAALDRPLPHRVFRERTGVTDGDLRRAFPKGWRQLQRAADLPPDPVANRFTNDDLLADYHALTQHLGRPPKVAEIAARCRASLNTYRNRFGSQRALRARYAEWLTSIQ